jgi:hypothetical protein
VHAAANARREHVTVGFARSLELDDGIVDDAAFRLRYRNVAHDIVRECGS